MFISWRVSLVAQLVKNLPAMWETWVWSLGWDNPFENGRLPTPVFSPREFHGLYSPWGHNELDTTEWLSVSFTFISWSLWFFIYKVTGLARKFSKIPSLKFHKWIHGRCHRALPPLLSLGNLCSAAWYFSLCYSPSPDVAISLGMDLGSSSDDSILFSRYSALDWAPASQSLLLAVLWPVDLGTFGWPLLPSLDG